MASPEDTYQLHLLAMDGLSREEAAGALQDAFKIDRKQATSFVDRMPVRVRRAAGYQEARESTGALLRLGADVTVTNNRTGEAYSYTAAEWKAARAQRLAGEATAEVEDPTDEVPFSPIDEYEVRGISRRTMRLSGAFLESLGDAKLSPGDEAESSPNGTSPVYAAQILRGGSTSAKVPAPAPAVESGDTSSGDTSPSDAPPGDTSPFRGGRRPVDAEPAPVDAPQPSASQPPVDGTEILRGAPAPKSDPAPPAYRDIVESQDATPIDDDQIGGGVEHTVAGLPVGAGLQALNAAPAESSDQPDERFEISADDRAASLSVESQSSDGAVETLGFSEDFVDEARPVTETLDIDPNALPAVRAKWAPPEEEERITGDHDRVDDGTLELSHDAELPPSEPVSAPGHPPSPDPTRHEQRPVLPVFGRQ